MVTVFDFQRQLFRNVFVDINNNFSTIYIIVFWFCFHAENVFMPLSCGVRVYLFGSASTERVGAYVWASLVRSVMYARMGMENVNYQNL